MEVRISNNDNGTIAAVSNDYQLLTQSEMLSLQHWISRYKSNTYQVIGTATVANSKVTVLHIKNTDSTRFLAVSYLRLAALGLTGGTAPPDVANYFDIGTGRTVSSGGATATPVNTNRSSGRVAVVTATQTAPTMTGTDTLLDRHYLKEQGEEFRYNKEGSVILGLNDTLEISFTSDNTAGTAYARVTFMMLDIEN